MKSRTCLILTVIASLFSVNNIHGQLIFSGNTQPPVTIIPEASTGIEAIYVLENTSGVYISHEGAETADWSKFSTLGGGHSDNIGKFNNIPLDATDMGYIANINGRQHCYWVVNYSNHKLDLQAIAVSPDSDCDRTVLNITGNGNRINYYTINGQPKELSREITVDYRTLSYDSESAVYRESPHQEIFASIDQVITTPAPLCNTDFTISGDRFLKAWGAEQQISSSYYNTTAVEATTTAKQQTTDFDNEQKDDQSELGGSAPAEITFSAAITDAVVFKEWQFSLDDEFEDILDRYNSETITHTFDSNGTTYVRFVAGNVDGSCFFYGDTYTVNIGESTLVCPNAFSPYNEDGVNDLWKVSYKSIISFECSIFNRWGKKLITLNHPSQGWDGKSGGKFVPSGVYFYVIKARGADGKEYNLSGDINLIKSRSNPNSSSSSLD